MSGTIDYSSMRRAGSRADATSVSTDPIQRILTGRYLPSEVKLHFADQTLRRRIIKRSNELLRQLKVRVRTRVNRHDSDETRAAVVLEFVLRTGIVTSSTGGNSDGVMVPNTTVTRAVPLDVLARQLGVRKQYVEEVQCSLSHYLEEIAGGDGKRGDTVAAPAGEETSGNANKHSTNERPRRGAAAASAPEGMSHSIGQPETIRDLSIRLGSVVPDAEGAARRGEALFAELGKQIVNSRDRFHRDARLSDLERNKVAYEAACFYVCATESEGGGDKRKGNGKSKNANINADVEGLSDEEEHRALSMADIASAARLSKNVFEDIAREVAKIATEIIISSQEAAAEKARKGGAREQKQRNANKKRKRGSNSEKDIEQSNLSHWDIIGGLEGKNKCERLSHSSGERLERGPVAPPPRQAFTPSAHFLAWKRQTLNDAIRRAKETGEGEKFSKDEALECVVNDIISHL
mmetsp:Transcript_32978/g.72326  ORF Transcript_32978/g.72326 Transcript_32978/m.72326 type:complete len:464 (-) Transcript_32978:110-1501(-)|eukprot:CAMPEP_0178564976 /NCGR_PEP_ID=MMETSP0697-20121206/13915_1 /TAXON_ID=265572 /ORGANISM="Extubocellulus spinifer, Strain CCMP396" /LENGTH=463 /DNA_ID=CAMNT_0020198551 /DNA_START=181 /DNA_END=1572 /DNA_ORIENTATION=+